jgi:dihydroflavonol-4-reductase
MSEHAKELVCVTGVSGYVGQHCAAELLQHGYRVRGTIRNAAKGDMIRAALTKVSDRVEDLEFAEADLLSDDGWAEAMKDCSYVLHVASPFIMGEPAHPDDLIKPAVEGTERVLKFAKDQGVKRLVLTSSTVAVSSDMEVGVGGPGDWADPEKVGTYAKSKILAERAAWRFIEAQDGGEKMDMVVINPGGIMGPTLTGQTTGTSTGMVADMLRGKMPMIPDIAVGMVDVRDVAKVHVTALGVPEAAGHRFILASDEAIPMMHVAETLKSAGYSKVSTRKAPSFLLKMMAPFSKDVKGMVSFLGRKVGSDNATTRKVLGWEPTPIETSLVDMAESLVLD